MSGYLRSGVTYRSALRAIVLVAIAMGVIALFVSRAFIEEVDAKNASLSQGFAEATVIDKHYLLPNLYGCKRADAIAFLVKAKRTKMSSEEEVTVCCGAWFSGCAVRDPKKE